MSTATKEQIDAARAAYETAQEAYYVLLRACRPHAYVQSGDSAKCAVCGQLGGWWCPTSPTKECEYEDSPDYCIHCGDPEERK